jgi:ParB-like chromosome segregation protein Spo0J
MYGPAVNSLEVVGPTRSLGDGATVSTSRPETPEVRLVRIAELSLGYSPRHTRLDEEHVKSLGEVIDRVPPIVVEERTMRVLDGVHRLEAARRAGRDSIKAVLFSGSDLEALVVAIQANVRHGKPLAKDERQAAAVTLLRRCPERSDRWLADVCGLSHTTVGRLREALEAKAHLVRTGRDLRARPVDPTQGQAAVAKALADDPSASVRQAARVAGVSPNTARRVAARLQAQQGEEPSSDCRPAAPGRAPIDVAADDLNISSGKSGWWDNTTVAASDLDEHLRDVPVGHIYEVVDECRRRSRIWSEIGDALERRAQVHLKSLPQRGVGTQ